MRSGWTGQDEEHLEACSAALTGCTRPTDALQPSSSVDALEMCIAMLVEVEVQQWAGLGEVKVQV